MDQSGAALLGAVIGLGGVGLTLAAQEARARAQDRRAMAERLGRTQGMARIVGSELKWMHTRVKHAPYDDVDGFNLPNLLSTKTWDQYGPDICVDLPLDVVDKLLVAYGAVETVLALSRGGAVTDDTISSIKQAGRFRVIEGQREVLEEQRKGLLKAIAGGYNALHPYFDQGGRATTPPRKPPALRTETDDATPST